MVLKTREKLIEVARQLFVHKGVENTTISDIANASDRGRRTIYTYFKNKREIYNAVLESESEKLVSDLRAIYEQPGTAQQKLEAFLYTRISAGRQFKPSSNSLRSLFSRDYRRMERIRALAYEKESVILGNILQQGVDEGVFDQQNCIRLNAFALKLMQGIDLSAALASTDDSTSDASSTSVADDETFTTHIIQFILSALKK